jgi:hypothetical protein
MAQIKDFVVRSGVIVQGTADVTTTTGSSGSLEVRGGASIIKSLVVGGSTTIYGNEILYGNMSITGQTTATGIVNITNSTAATSGGAGALTVAGGAYLGNNLVVNGSAASTATLTSNALYVVGGVGIGNSLVVNGPTLFKDTVTFNGTATYVYSTNTVITDNIINIHTPPGGINGAWPSNDGKDIGFVFHNYVNSTDNDAFLGWANDSGYLEWYSTGTENVSGVFTPGTYGVFKTGGVVLVNGTAATSTNTGALTVVGGLGLGGSIYAGGSASVNTLTSRTLTSGAVVIVGTGGLLTEDDGLRYDATTNILTTTVTNAITATNLSGTLVASIPYQTNPGITGYVPIGNSDEVLTVTAGLPTWKSLSSLPGTTSSVVATNIANGKFGEIPFQVTTSTTAFIGTGTTGSLLQMGANTATFVTTSSIYVGNAVTATNIRGGTAGALPYQSAAGVTQFINTGTPGSILQMGTGSTATFVSSSSVYVGDAVVATNLRGGTLGVIPYQNSAGATLFIGTGTIGSLLQMGANTATFVSTSSILVGAAVTASNATNLSGGTAGSIVYQINSGVTGFIGTGTVGSILQMGTGSTATFVSSSSVYVGDAVNSTNIRGGAAGAIHYQSAAGVTQFINTGTPGSILQMGTGSTATFVSSSSVYVGFANQAVYANTATNLAGGQLGQIPYQSATGTTLFIGTGTVGSLLQMGASTTATFVTTGSVYVGDSVNATNVRGGTAGSLLYQSAAGVTQFIGTGTVGSLLQVGANTATFVTTGSIHVGTANFAVTANTVLGSVSTASTVIISNDQSSAVPFYLLAVTATSGAQTLTGNSSWGPYFTPSTGQLVVNTTTNASNAITGALVVKGGAGFGGKVYLGDGTISNATNTGALLVSGGAGISGAVYASGSVTAGGAAVSGSTVNGFFSNNFLISSFTSNTISTTSTQNLDTYTTSTYRTAKYTVQIVDGTSVHASELLVFHANGNVYLNEYGIVTSGSTLGTFDASIVSGSVTLQFTPSAATAMTIKVVRTAIAS